MSTNFLLDQGGEPQEWTNLNVKSLKTRNLYVLSNPSTATNDFYLNTNTDPEQGTVGDDLNDGLSPLTPVLTWKRLMDVAGSKSGSIAILNIDGLETDTFDPSEEVVPAILDADCLWDFSPVSYSHDYVTVRGPRKDSFTLPQGAASNTIPLGQFRFWNGLALTAAYTHGISRFQDGDNYGFEAVSSYNAPDEVIIAGQRSNEFGGELFNVGGPQLDIRCKCAIVSQIPVSIETMRIYIVDQATEFYASLRNRTPTDIKVNGCVFDTHRINYFGGDWTANGCVAFSDDHTTASFFNSSNLLVARNCHLIKTPMTVRNHIVTQFCRFDDSKFRVENVACESTSTLHLNSVDDCIDLDSAIYDMQYLECIQVSPNPDHHCMDIERSRANIKDCVLKGISGAAGTCVTAINSDVDFSRSLDMSKSSLTTGDTCVAREGSHITFTPQNDAGGVTPDFKIQNFAGAIALRCQINSDCLIKPYTTRIVTPNPASISSTGTIACDIEDNSSLKLYSILGQPGDLSFSSIDTAIRLTDQSKATIGASGLWANNGAGANFIQVGGQAPTAGVPAGFSGQDLATSLTNQGCALYS